MSNKNNKEIYLDAEIEVTELSASDVITTSTTIGGGDEDDGGWTKPSDKSGW